MHKGFCGKCLKVTELMESVRDVFFDTEIKSSDPTRMLVLSCKQCENISAIPSQDEKKIFELEGKPLQ
jgi:hypothetical protein